MINGKSVSVGAILWRIVNNPIASEITIDYAAELALNFLRLMMAPLSMKDVVEIININEYKARLPENMVNVRGVSYIGENENSNIRIPLRYASDIYHTSNRNLNECSTSEMTYVLQSCNIITSMKSGFLEVSYQMFEIDENGFPYIPDNESLKKALEYHIIFKYIEPLWTVGKIPDKVFNYYSQQSMWYFGQAENSLKLANIDQLETTMNAINRILVSTTTHRNGYKQLGEKEIIKQHH